MFYRLMCWGTLGGYTGSSNEDQACYRDDTNDELNHAHPATLLSEGSNRLPLFDLI